MHAVDPTRVPPQQHSHDRLVRLRADTMERIVLEHVCTVQDPSVLLDVPADVRHACRAGLTEWQGRIAGRLVSLGWDWLRLQDGAIVASTATAPRTNLMLIDRSGYDCSAAERDAVLWRLVAATPWQREMAI